MSGNQCLELNAMCICLMALQILPVFPFLGLSSHLMPYIFTILDPCVLLWVDPVNGSSARYKRLPYEARHGIHTLEPGEELQFV
jgi:hypothetical protein